MSLGPAETAGAPAAESPVSDPAVLRALAARARRHVIEAVAHAGAGHIGGPLSAMDILVALYFAVLRVDPRRPLWAERDRFILSKGHSAVGLYAVLALRGYFPVSWLATFDHLGSPLQGHPDMTRCPGVEMSTGSLGQGLSAGLGMALGAERLGLDSRVFVLLGDGECQEGQVWECAHAAARYRARRLRAIVDWNGLPQYAWPGAAPLALERLDVAARFSAFGWEVVEVDGHDPAALVAVLGREPSGPAPLAVIARTHKGEGVSFMRDQAAWHARVPTAAERAAAVYELLAAGGGPEAQAPPGGGPLPGEAQGADTVEAPPLGPEEGVVAPPGGGSGQARRASEPAAGDSGGEALAATPPAVPRPPTGASRARAPLPVGGGRS